MDFGSFLILKLDILDIEDAKIDESEQKRKAKAPGAAARCVILE